ncbi:protein DETOXIFICATION 51 [Euphorbia lathyris]|uniref:protein DETOXIFICATION 51 n=1 Tax=Euphorbia lathyris TaxID=212925 RepID=UPI0033140F3D
MCNPDTTKSLLPPPPQTTHIYLDLLTIKDLGLSYLKPNPPESNPPCVSELISETKSLFKLAFPIAFTGLILYYRSILSMFFLGHLGDMELAAGSLAIAFANITGYSVLSGLALGMEPLCSQAFGAHHPKLLSVTLHRSVIFLLVSSIPILILWINMSRILVYLHQDPTITQFAHTYLLFSLPDLLINSFIHPIRIYLRAQGITHPLTFASLIGSILHLPINLLLVNHFNFGVAGVAAAAAASNFVVLFSLISYVWVTSLHKPTWTKPTRECFVGWKPLIRLAAPSCVSVCLEWWWYEIMIVLCGLLVNPKSSVASMGILIQTTSLLYVFPSSLGFAVSTRVGNELGANRPNRAKLSAVVAVFFSAMMGLTACSFASGMKDRWGRMFTSDGEILRLTAAALPIVGLCEIGNCPQTVGCGVLRGSARPASAAHVNLGAFYMVGMPVAIGLGFWLDVGFCGLWFGLLAAQICCSGLMLYVVGSTDWDFEARRAQTLTYSGYDSTELLDDLSEEEEEEQQMLKCIIV